MVTSLILISLLPSVLALNVTINSPQTANSEFDVSLSPISAEIYDIKIYIKASSDVKSEIFYKNSWKSSFYFLKSAFPNQTTFSIRVLNFTGSGEVCAKLRKPGKTQSTEFCNPIFISLLEQPDDLSSYTKNESIILDTNNSDDNIDKQVEQAIPHSPDFIPLENAHLKSNQDLEENISNVPVSDAGIFISHQEKIRQGIMYSFTLFCILIIIFLVIRRL